MNQLTDAYCDVDEAAGILEIHPESVRRLIRRDQLKAEKLGNKWMISRAYMRQYARWYDPRPGNGPARIIANIPNECPGCGEGDTRTHPLIIADSIGRHWHLHCAENALGRVEGGADEEE